MCAHEKMLKTLKGCNVYAKPEVALLRSHGKLPANRRRSLSINRGRISEERVIATMAVNSKQSQKESFVRMDDDVNHHLQAITQLSAIVVDNDGGYIQVIQLLQVLIIPGNKHMYCTH